MPGKLKKQIDSSDEGSQDEYLKDDFVVGSDEDEDNDEQINSVDEEYNNEQLSDDELALIEENKKGQRKSRLKKQEDDEIMPPADESIISDEQFDDQPDEVDQNELVNRLFDPTQRDMAFLNQNDEDIVKFDVPERIQIAYMKQNGGKMLNEFRNEPGEEHLRWIVERLFRERQFPQSEHPDLLKGIKMILDAHRKENLEMMYIFTYKKHLITQLLKPEDYWRIQELDQEYEQYSRFKKKIIDSIIGLPNGPHIATIQLALDVAFNLNDLQNLKEYITYLQLKLKCKLKSMQSLEEETQNLSLTDRKHAKKERLLVDLMRLRVDELLPRFCYTADEYFDVLQGKRVELNRAMFTSVDLLTNEYVNSQHSLVNNSAELFKTMQKYLTMELFHHPIIRDHVAQLYKKLLQITTEPTPLGNREITALSYLYPVKRIKSRPIKYLEDQIWLMALRAEEQGYIKIRFHISRELDQKGDKMCKDDLMMALMDKFTNLNLGMDVDGGRINKLRDYIFQSVLREQWYPSLERQIRQQLKQAATKHIQMLCEQQFRVMINKQPHQCESKDREVRIMSLVLTNEQSCAQTLKSYTMDYTIQKKHIGMSIVDSKGQCLHLHVFNYLTVDERRLELNDLMQKEKSLLESLIEQYKPDTIVISANQPECLRLRADLRNNKKYRLSNEKLWVTVSDNTVAHIYSLSERSQQQLVDLPPLLREAVSLARYQLNPLAEILNIWHEKPDKNGCLHINMHPLQNMISQQALSDTLERVAIEIVNSVGVDLVDSALYPHLQGLMQFVTGLGPRKALHVSQMFKALLSKQLFNNNYENEKRIIQKLSESQASDYVSIQRSDIIKTQLLTKTVYKNMQGFVKILNGVNPLDSTRLLLKMYGDATHIAKSAMDVQGKDDKYNTVLRQLMQNPRLMADLELEDWAMKKEQRDGTENYFKVVNFIIQELTNPFSHNYDQTKKGDMTNEEIFYAVTQESPHTFKKNTIVSGPIIRLYNKEVLVKLSDNGLMGTLPKEDYVRDLQVGQVVKAHVKTILALEEQKQSSSESVNIFKVALSLKAEWDIKSLIVGQPPAVWPYPFSFEEYSEKIRNTFDIDRKAREQDLPIIQMPTVQKQQKLILRNINHPKFKQVLMKGALDYINSQPVGEYIIRPNTKHRDYLTITWKFFESVIAHLYIQEQQRAGSYKPILIMNNMTFESFDEIFERYIVPCNLLMEAVANNKKFINGTMEQLETRLKDEKEKADDIIPYGFCVTDKAPLFVVLMYMKEKAKVEKEYIKVKPEGLSFHSIVHQNLKELTIWFKKNFRTSEYKMYVKRTKPPFSENDRLGQINQQWDIKKEKYKEEKIKTEEQHQFNVSCAKCGKRGHNANDCRSDRYDRPYKDNNSGNRGCHNCGQNGHIKKNCPTLNSGGNNSNYRKRDRSNSRDREKQQFWGNKSSNNQPKVEEQIDY